MLNRFWLLLTIALIPSVAFGSLVWGDKEQKDKEQENNSANQSVSDEPVCDGLVIEINKVKYCLDFARLAFPSDG